MSILPGMIWDLLIRLSWIGLFVLLAVAYATGDEYPHTHVMIGYAIAALVITGIFWIVIRPRHARFPQIEYSPRGITAQINKAGIAPKALASVFFILATLPLCALVVMLLTHLLWGTTRVDEMHEVVAYFAIGLTVLYTAMVAIASIGHIKYRLQKMPKDKTHQL